MDTEMSVGESSNTSNNNNNRSLSNNNDNSNSSTNQHRRTNVTPDSSHKPSSSNNVKKRPSSITDDSSNFDSADDIGWRCSLCTFTNSSDRFKCEMCDLRRGTSTRKPRCNADTIVAQVVKQQEQIRQQTKVKQPKSRSRTSKNINASSPSGSKIRSKTSKSSKGHSDSEDHLSDTNSLPPKAKKKKKEKKSDAMKSKKSKSANNRPAEGDDESTESDSTISTVSSIDTSDSSSSSSESSDTTSESSSTFTHPSFDDESDGPEATIPNYPPAFNLPNRELEVKTIKRPIAVPPPISQIKTPDNPFKITPLEVSGNLIKYSPPTSSGRTGLIIDKKRFTQHSVTVNDVTITFTEFATRQNTYVRKKKKRRDGIKPKSSNGSSKSRPKSQPKSSSNSASTKAAEAP